MYLLAIIIFSGMLFFVYILSFFCLLKRSIAEKESRQSPDKNELPFPDYRDLQEDTITTARNKIDSGLKQRKRASSYRYEDKTAYLNNQY